MKIIDAHSHIDYITHMFQSNVVGTICCTINELQWGVLSDMSSKDDRIYSAFGIHPWFVDSVENGFEQRLTDLLKTNRFFMVGEIGLDKYKPNMDKQIDVFDKQFSIAICLKRPVFLHCVGAWDKIFNVLKKYKKSELPIIIVHDFHGSDEIINNLLNNYNVMFSFGKIDKSQEIHRIQQIPYENILVESDGKSNVFLAETVEKISEIKNNKNIDDIIFDNTQKVLQYGQIE